MHQFDTYRLVQKLEGEGFSREAAEAIMASLSEVVFERCVWLGCVDCVWLGWVGFGIGW